MKYFEKKKGVTLIELVIALGLIGIVTALVFTFFFSNQRTIDEVGVKSDLQYEAKVALESISKYAMEAATATWDGTKKELSFDLLNEDGTKVSKAAVFTQDGSDINLKVMKWDEINKKYMVGSEEGSQQQRVLCKYVDSMDADVDNTSGNVSIELKLKHKSVSYSVKDNYLFRNSHK